MAMTATAVIALIAHPAMHDFLALAGLPAPMFMLTIVVTAELKEPGRLKQTAVMLFAMPWPLRTMGPYLCVSVLMR